MPSGSGGIGGGMSPDDRRSSLRRHRGSVWGSGTLFPAGDKGARFGRRRVRLNRERFVEDIR